MSQLLQAARRKVKQAAEDLGLAELARRSDVPVSTLHDWQQEDWRPRTLRAFEKVAGAAEAHAASPNAAAPE